LECGVRGALEESARRAAAPVVLELAVPEVAVLLAVDARLPWFGDWLEHSGVAIFLTMLFLEPRLHESLPRWF
jgi:hypothetical protein